MLLLTAWVALSSVSVFANPPTEPEAHTQILQKLRTGNLRIQLARVTVLEAQSRSRFAWSAALPHLDWVSRQIVSRFDPNRYGLPESGGSLNWVGGGASGLDLAVSVFDLASWIRISAAQQAEDGARAQIGAVFNEIAFAAFVGASTIARAHQRLEFAEKTAHLSEKILKLAQTKLRSGAGLRLDELRANAAYRSDQAKVLAARSALTKAQSDLALLLGDADIPESFAKGVELESENPADLIAALKAERRSAASVALQMQEESAATWLSAEKKAWLPKLRLASELGFFGPGSLLGFANSTLNGSLGLQLTFPIFEGGLAYAKQLQAQAALTKAQAQRAYAELEIQQQKSIAAQQLEQSAQIVDSALSVLNAATEEARVFERKYAGGTGGFLEFSQSRSQLASAQEQWAEAKHHQALAVLNAKRVLGHWENANEQ